jgi:hypothetical protein
MVVCFIVSSLPELRIAFLPEQKIWASLLGMCRIPVVLQQAQSRLNLTFYYYPLIIKGYGYPV